MIDFKKQIEEEERHANRASLTWEQPELIINNKKRKRFITYTIAIVVVALIFSGRILVSSQNATNWFPEDTFFGKIKHLITSHDKLLAGEDEDQINILLLGMGGEGHEGAYLTDTIILASLKPSTKQVAMISLPRDLVSPVNGWRKINSINAYAEQKNQGSGGEATTRAISELLETPITYYVRVDFSGFAKIIDELGGIEVNVENTLDDYTYPIFGQEDNPNYYARFEHLHIDKGVQNMDGSLALKYARSRHALSSEGSDFARSRRQQLVLEAIKNKILSSKILLNPTIIAKLINEFNKNISTNLSAWEILRLWDLFKDINRDQIINKVLSDAPDGLLVAGQGEDGAYILVPRSGNFAEIKNLVRNIFSAAPLEQKSSEPRETINDNAKIIVLNGTWITGLATKSASQLTLSKFNVVEVGNAPLRDFSQTTFYDLTYGKKNESLEALKRITGANQSFDSPEWIQNYKINETYQADFLLILGANAE
ncbi:MAG: Cell envelope-related transcriptional attenuator [Candidatus Falkowbacteria bacterium GW2011_GWF2_43_32]|nr:MAG: Cell envelope-related transcriptional attenuator [Candidatus Falkowbacteria bacterium GW2011_GWF2_43_32]